MNGMKENGKPCLNVGDRVALRPGSRTAHYMPPTVGIVFLTESKMHEVTDVHIEPDKDTGVRRALYELDSSGKFVELEVVMPDFSEV